MTSHPGQLSLAIPLWVGAIEYQPKGGDVLQLGSMVWFVCRWQVKLCDPLVTHGPYLSALEVKVKVKVNVYLYSASS